MNVQLQFQWLLIMGWTGWQLTGMLDTLHVLMRASGIHQGIRACFLVLFSGWGAFYLFRQLYFINGGELRLALLAAAAVGGWIYWIWFRRWVERITESIVRIIRLVLQYCKRLLLFIFFRPLWVFLTIATRPLRRLLIRMQKYSLTKLAKHIKIFKRHLTKND